MAVLVLSFSIIPCADETSIAKEEVENYSMTASTPQGEPQDDECSPFCICTCCAGVSVTCSSSALSAITIPHKLIYSSFIQASTHSFAAPIWQPPQLI